MKLDVVLLNLLIGFLIGCVFYFSIKGVNFIIEKTLKINSDEKILEIPSLSIKMKEFFLLCITFSITYVLNIIFHSNFTLILLLSVFVSYGFILKPYIYSRKAKNRDWELEKYVKTCGYKVKIFISEKNFSNVLSYGSIPVSNIIILSKDIKTKFDNIDQRAIILHEIGHIKKFHLLYIYIYNLIVVFSFSNMLKYIFREYHEKQLLIIVFSCLIFGLLWYFLIVPIMRIFEYQADLFASKIIGKEEYIQMLYKFDILTHQALSNNDFYHPSLKNRISYVSKNNKQ